MKAVFQQRGDSIDFVNNTGADIKANDVVTLTSRIGVASMDIPVGSQGTVHVVGVFSLPAETTTAFNVGQTVYLSNNTISATSSDTVAGFVVAPKAANGTVALVKIG